MLHGKTVVVGVCGGIAAYKVVDVVSRLRKLNADVHVIMTEHAKEFVTPVTFQSISHNPVVDNMFERLQHWDIKHISLAEKADLVLVAPATANIIGKAASGLADDMLTTTLTATKAPVLFIPAMNYNMYANPVVQSNITRLKSIGYHFMEPETGPMAEGSSGKGRLPEPASIVDYVSNLLLPVNDLSSKRILITAGPTREAIDPVRYISNHSSGKMGYAIAEAAAVRGASVRLISGPVNIGRPINVEVIDIITAQEMYDEVIKNYHDCDILIMAAAVADYRCAHYSEEKIKKSADPMVIELTKNPDIAAEVGKIKSNKVHIGFCAETNHLIENAKAKLDAKNFDMIVANDVTKEGAGFGVDTNIVKILKKDGRITELPILMKKEVAHKILDEVVKQLTEINY